MPTCLFKWLKYTFIAKWDMNLTIFNTVPNIKGYNSIVASLPVSGAIQIVAIHISHILVTLNEMKDLKGIRRDTSLVLNEISMTNKRQLNCTYALMLFFRYSSHLPKAAERPINSLLYANAVKLHIKGNLAERFHWCQKRQLKRSII